jgi:hypothetical protein
MPKFFIVRHNPYHGGVVGLTSDYLFRSNPELWKQFVAKTPTQAVRQAESRRVSGLSNDMVALPVRKVS